MKHDNCLSCMHGQEYVHQKVMADIQRTGWSDIAVFPTDDDPGTNFNYTVGLAERDHPDLIMIGLDNHQMHHVMISAVHALSRVGRFEPDTYYPEVLEDLRIAFVKVLDPMDDSGPMTMVRDLYGEVHGLQLVWPDEHDHFPWDEEFLEEYRPFQPLRGIWRGP